MARYIFDLETDPNDIFDCGDCEETQEEQEPSDYQLSKAIGYDPKLLENI